MQEDLMNSKIISRAACLAELTSNPKSFFNCPDLHGGSGSPEDWKLEDKSSKLGAIATPRRPRRQSPSSRLLAPS
jgi:hypothetical protein